MRTIDFASASLGRELTRRRVGQYPFPRRWKPPLTPSCCRLNALGFTTRYEGDGQSVSFIATHRLHGHFFAYTGSVGNEYEAVCIVAEMCGLERSRSNRGQ